MVVITTTTVWACEIPKMIKKVSTNELVKMPVGSEGSIVSDYVDGSGVRVTVVEFSEGLWAWCSPSTWKARVK